MTKILLYMHILDLGSFANSRSGYNVVSNILNLLVHVYSNSTSLLVTHSGRYMLLNIDIHVLTKTCNDLCA